MSEKYAVLDVEGKVRDWLTASRGLRVWSSQEIGTNRPDMMTPGDVTTEPHWAYKGGDRLLSREEVTFYLKGHVYFDGRRSYEWSSTHAGYKAAIASLDGLPKDNGNAPLKLSFEYTVEEVHYATAETGSGGQPLGHHFRYAVIQWSAARE